MINNKWKIYESIKKALNNQGIVFVDPYSYERFISELMEILEL